MIFENNIISIYGERGRRWLAKLPQIVEKIAIKYNLSNLQPFDNLSYNCVYHGFQNTQSIVLKIGLDAYTLKREAIALRAFSEYGAVKILSESDRMIIIEHVIPGTPLKKDKNSIKIVCDMMKKLHQASYNKAQFPNIRDWLEIFDKNWDINENYLQEARKLRDKFLKNSNNEVLIHGDLHHGNILQNGAKKWIIIDPKGVIGPSIAETFAFIIDIERDSKFIANYFGFNQQEVIKWYFIRIILSICWNLEDHIDPKFFINLADKCYLLI